MSCSHHCNLCTTLELVSRVNEWLRDTVLTESQSSVDSFRKMQLASHAGRETGMMAGSEWLGHTRLSTLRHFVPPAPGKIPIVSELDGDLESLSQHLQVLAFPFSHFLMQHRHMHSPTQTSGCPRSLARDGSSLIANLLRQTQERPCAGKASKSSLIPKLCCIGIRTLTTVGTGGQLMNVRIHFAQRRPTANPTSTGPLSFPHVPNLPGAESQRLKAKRQNPELTDAAPDRQECGGCSDSARDNESSARFGVHSGPKRGHTWFSQTTHDLANPWSMSRCHARSASNDVITHH